MDDFFQASLKLVYNSIWKKGKDTRGKKRARGEEKKMKKTVKMDVRALGN